MSDHLPSVRLIASVLRLGGELSRELTTGHLIRPADNCPGSIGHLARWLDCAHKYTRSHIHTHTHTHTQIRSSNPAGVPCTGHHMYTHTLTNVYTYIYTCIYIYAYTHIYVHTYIHK